jgi:catechol 2,3-dioxygenase-like lactoylglutathione lyase family enzyme
MFERVTIHASDFDESRRFYETVLGALGLRPSYASDEMVRWQDLAVARGGGKVTRRLHVGIVAPSREHVDAFWQAGIDAGYRSDGDPGPRPQYREEYYGAFLLDPDGNSAEAVHHGALRQGGLVDHLWIRVADVDVSKAFYEAIAPDAGLSLEDLPPERAIFHGESGSFSLVPGDPTEHLTMALPSARGAAVVDPDGNLVALTTGKGGPVARE